MRRLFRECIVNATTYYNVHRGLACEIVFIFVFAVQTKLY